MQINDSFIIQAPIESVWAFFMDVERTSQCVPGVQAFEAIDDRNFRGELKVKVGPISAQFKGTAVLSEVIPTSRLVAGAQANDKTTRSMVKADFESELTAVEEGTRVDYQMEVNLRGRLAQFGSTVFQSTAKKLTAEFVECVQAQLAKGEES